MSLRPASATPQGSSSPAIPLRRFGSQDVQISALGLGGHHLGDAADQAEATRIVHAAIEGGVTFFDNCWEYHRGKSECWMGDALKGFRNRVFVMTKVCTHGREGSLATQMLEQSLRRLQTDHLDLWQAHGIGFDNDPELFMRPKGTAEAMARAKQQGKVRFLGFTGHKCPEIHLKMLGTGFPFDAVQMPLNAFDAHFHSFEQHVLPRTTKARNRRAGNEAHQRSRRSGIERRAKRRRDVALRDEPPGGNHYHWHGKDGRPSAEFKNRARFSAGASADQMNAIRERTRQTAGDGRFELYKVSLKFDNPEARLAHEFPLDRKSVEVQEMVKSPVNNGHPYFTKAELEL